MSKIKIYVSCHKEVFVPQNELLFPIQVGTALAPKEFDGMLHDNTGENISEKNKMYCELTAQYWAWKNDDADYYGFFHYRRYFNFSENNFKANHFQDVVLDSNDEKTLSSLGINEKTMASLINKYDVIAPKQGGFASRLLSIYKQYEISRCQEIEDLDFVLNVIKIKYPQMFKHAKKYIKGNKGYFCNMFIMKKEIFNKYSEWLFDILEEHENSKDFSKYSVEKYRVSGYLAERLCGIYLSWLKKQKNIKFCELQRTMFNSTDKISLPSPVFKKNNIPVVLATNDFFAPYASVTFQSIIENSNKENNYDIIILSRDISEFSKKLLKKQVQGKENFSLRFFDISHFMKGYDKLYTRGHFKIETYFRFFLQEILCEYDKALYLDCDLVVLDDIAKLFNEDIGENYFGACQDADTIGLYQGAQRDKKTYTDQILKLKDPYSYFQAGVLIFNLKELRRKYSSVQMLEKAMEYDWQLLDQDVLNFLAQGKVHFIDMSWNVLFDWHNRRINEIISQAPRDVFNKYMESRKNPKIIHFAGPNKPWQSLRCDFAEVFWQYAKMSPFYEIIFSNTIVGITQAKKKKQHKLLKKLVNFFFPYGSRRRKLLKKIYERLTRR